MLIAPLAEDLFGLNNLGRETVTVADALWAGTSLDELGRDPKIVQVSLLLDRVGAEHLEEFGHSAFGQALDVIVTSEHGPRPLAQTALQLRFVLVLLKVLSLDDVFQPALQHFSILFL